MNNHGAILSPIMGPLGPLIFSTKNDFLSLPIFKTLMWVKQCHANHPPVITIFIGGINQSKQSGLLTLKINPY